MRQPHSRRGRSASAWRTRPAACSTTISSAQHLPDFPYKPETYFAFSVDLVALALGFAAGFCVLGAWRCSPAGPRAWTRRRSSPADEWRAAAASRHDPAGAISARSGARAAAIAG